MSRLPHRKFSDTPTVTLRRKHPRKLLHQQLAGRDDCPVGELAKLYGNDVQALDYTIGGRKVIVPQDATPFTISGEIYRNPWLGLTVQKPQTFRFTQLDAVWPNTTVVAMEGPRQQVVKIQGHSASLPVANIQAKKNCCEMPKFQGREPKGRLWAIA